MAENDRRRRREEAAEFWASNEVTEANSVEVTEEVVVRKPLSATLSLRISDEDLANLKLVAAAQGVGITTMARILLQKVLRNPGQQLMLQALRTKEVEEGVTDIIEEAKIPKSDGETEFLVLSRTHLERISMTLTEVALGSLLESLAGQSISVTPREGQLYEHLRKLSAVN